MTTTTRERNYRKNPHTATFLQTFHSGISSTGRNYREEMNVTAETDADLLDLVEDKDVVDLRTPGQVHFMEGLIGRLAALDPATGEAARAYTEGMTEHGKWTPGRTGNASEWIDRMLSKEAALKAARPAAHPAAAPQPTETPEIPAHRYGILKDGEVKCYEIDYGKEGTKWAGFLFLNRISSDDRFAIRNPVEKSAILTEIAKDVEAAQILAGKTLRRCRRCGRGLSDTKNPYFEVALGPDCGTM